MALFQGCVANGLQMKQEAVPMALQKLSEGSNVMIMAGPDTSNEIALPTSDGSKQLWQTLAKADPVAALSVLFQVGTDSPIFSGGVQYYELEDTNHILDVASQEANSQSSGADMSGHNMFHSASGSATSADALDLATQHHGTHNDFQFDLDNPDHIDYILNSTFEEAETLESAGPEIAFHSNASFYDPDLE